MELKDIFAIIGISIPFAGLINLILYQFFFLPKVNKEFKKFEFELKQKDLINQEQWKHKREACFNALNIADAILSNYKYDTVKDGDMKLGKITTEEVRKCFNDLACSCRDTKVIEILKQILFDPVNLRLDIIVDLRNAVRLELDFGNQEFDKDRDKSFVVKIAADPAYSNLASNTKPSTQ